MRLWDFALFLFHMQSVCVAKFAATTVSLADYCIHIIHLLQGRFYNLQTLKADTTRARRTSPGLYRIANTSSSCGLLPLSPQMCAGRNKQRRPDGPSSARWHSQGSGVRVSEWTCINWSREDTTWYNKNHQEWWCYFDMLYIHILICFDLSLHFIRFASHRDAKLERIKAQTLGTVRHSLFAHFLTEKCAYYYNVAIYYRRFYCSTSI